MFDFVEPRVRRVVAEHLGIGAEELAPEVSLTDDLAADSLDLLELALGLEAELGIHIPESAIEYMHTFGDLVAAVQAFAQSHRHARRDAEVRSAPVLVWARVVPPRAQAELCRAGWLTPYTAETIAEDALRAGRGARLEVTVPASVGEAGVAELQDELAWLGDRGVEVSVRRHETAPAGHRSPRPAAA